MGKRREPTEAEKLAEQRALIKDALDTGKTELDLRTESMDVVREACAVKTLTKLTLKLGSLKTLPKEIGNLTALESLHIDNNELTSLPDEIGALVNVHTFYAYSNKFSKLPDSFGDLASLKKLVIWQNELTSLPKSFGNLKKLTECEVKWNKLKSLPDEINGLESLEEFDASSNQLKDLPSDLSGMKKLRRLVLETNSFSTFPEGILTLPAIVEIDLSENKLKELPESLARAKTLRELDLEENAITALPKAIFSLPITSLKLNQNKLKELPAEIATMRDLAELTVWDNPIKGLDDQSSRGSKNEIFQVLGFWKPRTVAPAPAEPARGDAVKKRSVKLEKFAREAKRRGGEKLIKLVAYLKGQSDEVPASALDDEYHLSAITDMLDPFPEWNFIDERIMAFITQDAWRFKKPGQDYFSGFDENFFSYLKPHLDAEPEGSTLFSDVAKKVLSYGIPEQMFTEGAMRHLHEKMLREDGQPTSFGRYLIDIASKNEALILAQDRDSVKEALIALLIRHAKDVFARVGDKLLVIAPDEDGDVHIPYDALDHACAVEPARYEKLLLEGIEKTTCDPCRAEAGRVLVARYPKQRARALEVAKKTLARIAERKNKEDRYEFYWSGGKRWDDGTAQYIQWAFTTFGDEVKSDIATLVEKTKAFDVDVAEVIAKMWGQSAIDTLAEGLKMDFDDDDIAPHFRRMFALLAPLDWSKYHDLAWKLARSEHKQVRETACLALGRLDAKIVLPKAKELLEAKRGHEREAGVMLLTLMNDAESKKLLEQLLATEKSDDARDLAAKTFFAGTKCDRREADARVASAEARGKLDKPVAKWLDEKKLPKLAWAKDAESSRSARRALSPPSPNARDGDQDRSRGARRARARRSEKIRRLRGQAPRARRQERRRRGEEPLRARARWRIRRCARDPRARKDRDERSKRERGAHARARRARWLDRSGDGRGARARPHHEGVPREVSERARRGRRSVRRDRRARGQDAIRARRRDDLGLRFHEGQARDRGNEAAALCDGRIGSESRARRRGGKRREAAEDAAGEIEGRAQGALGVGARVGASAEVEPRVLFDRAAPLGGARVLGLLRDESARAFVRARLRVGRIRKGPKLVATFRVTADGERVSADGKIANVPKAAEIGLVHPLEIDASERANGSARSQARTSRPRSPSSIARRSRRRTTSASARSVSASRIASSRASRSKVAPSAEAGAAVRSSIRARCPRIARRSRTTKSKCSSARTE